MSKSVTNPIKSFIPQRTGTRYPSCINKGILKFRYDYSNRSASVYLLEYLLSVPDTEYWEYGRLRHPQCVHI